MTTIFKIRSKLNPTLFIAGAPSYLRWVKHGERRFQSISGIRSFITSSMNNNITKPNFSDWDIVEYEEIECSSKDVAQVVTSKKLMELIKLS